MTYDTPFTPSFLEVYCGPMKSGKSMALIQRVEKLRYMTDIKYAFFKPDTDTRENSIHSRFSKIEYPCTLLPSNNPDKIFDYLDGEKVILFDEAQFFGKNIVSVVNELLDRKLNVVAAGLDLDYLRQPFGTMPDFLALAGYVEKLKAVCEHKGCNKDGRYTKRNRNVPGQIVIENSPDLYSVTCLKHHRIPE